MANNLLIVESPAKAKTIEKILGKDFVVRSCYGHIRDLKKKDGIDVENGYEPAYAVPSDKKAVVKELKEMSKGSEVWLATDEDREGEAISWHLCEVLGLDADKAKRIVFHEITPSAIRSAVENPRRLNKDLVNAQQARRVLDRLVGFELSPVLWRKLSRPSLSAGRVQSVAVRLIVEREREIINFQSQSSFRITADFLKEGTGDKVPATLNKRPEELAEAREFLEACAKAAFTVGEVQVKPSSRTPAPPFTTSTLQQEASRKLGFSVSKTMSVAQRLYESGKITYMRTDSVNLSDLARNTAAKYIREEFGEDYSQPRNYTTRSKGAQEAHEAIRPTYIDQEDEGSNRDEQRLYELIWKRTIASQMSNAEIEKTTVRIDVSGRPEYFEAKGEVIKFPGFLKVYLESTDDDEPTEDSNLLPALTEGDSLTREKITATERFTRPPARYSEASLVKKLEELQIGRPSTYAPTISTIQKRNYVVKESRPGDSRSFRLLTLSNGQVKEETSVEIYGSEKSKLFPTDMGMLVNDFLMEHFSRVMDYGFTARIEREFDDIAQGEKEWREMIDLFYKPFHKEVENTIEHADRITGSRELGTDPKTGKPVIARLGRYGPMVQIGAQEDEEKPQYAKLRANQSIETITLEEALELFKLPRVVGSYEDEEIKAGIGRFGPYILHKDKFISLGKLDPHSVTEEEAVELIEQKREADKNKYIKEFEKEGIQVLNGRYGPYIKQGRKNFKIPKGYEAEELSLQDCLEIIESSADKKKGKKKKS